MTDQEFDYHPQAAPERSAIVLEAGKQYLVETRLAPLRAAIELGLDRRVCIAPSALSRATDCTADRRGHGDDRDLFFRDHHPFEALRKAVIPELDRSATPTSGG